MNTTTTVDTVMENNTNTPKQIPYSIQNLLQIPQEQLTAAFPQNMVGFKSAYDKNNNFIPLKFIKALNKKLNIQTQWPVLDIKEKDQLYDEGYGFNFAYLTNDDKILVTYDMFIIMQQLVHYDFKPYISVEIQQNLFLKYHTINWQINQNPPPPVVRPKTKKQTTKRQTTTKTTNKAQKQKVQNNEEDQGQVDDVQDNEVQELKDVQGQVDEVKDVQETKNVQTKKTQPKKVQAKKEQDQNDTNVDEQPKPKRRTTKKAKTQDILEQLNQNVANTAQNNTANNQPSQNVDQQNIEQQNIIHEFENTIKQCETTQNDEPTTTDNINNLLTTTDQDNVLTEEELKTTANIDNLLDFDAL